MGNKSFKELEDCLKRARKELKNISSLLDGAIAPLELKSIKDRFKYPNHLFYGDITYHEDVERISLPGVFDFHEAQKMAEMIGNGFKVPNVFEASCMVDEFSSLKFMTSEFKEFGEDGNWIYIASRHTDLTKSMRDSKEGYVFNYLREPVYNYREHLTLIKVVARYKINCYGNEKKVDHTKALPID